MYEYATVHASGFSLSPPPPENPALLYGFLPLNYHPPKPVPTLIPKALDKRVAYRFSLGLHSSAPPTLGLRQRAYP